MRSVSLIFLALWAMAAMSAQVYRSVDTEGNVTYSDRPDDERAEAVFIATQRPATPPATIAASEPSGTETASAEEPGELQQERREPTPEERAEDRARNCAIARERHERYLISHRLYRETPDGEREYLDDAELDEARARAAADVQEWCD